jgi:hypothetical protein
MDACELVGDLIVFIFGGLRDFDNIDVICIFFTLDLDMKL